MNKTTDKISPLEEILERITDAFVALDKNWRYTYMNKRAGDILHCDPKQIIGKHIWAEFPESVGQPFHKAFEKAMSTQQYVFLEEYYPPTDKWFENHIYPSPDGLSVYFRCITEKKKAEEALTVSEEKFRTLFERNLAGVYRTKTNGDILTFNDAFARIMGYSSRKELLKKDARALYFSNNDREEFISRLRKKGELINLEFTMKNKEGNPVYIIENCALHKNELTGEEFIEGVMIDITERKQMEETLRKSEEQFRRVVEHIHDALMVDDVQGTVVYANEQFFHLFGFKNKDLGTIRLEDYVAPDFRKQLRERHEKRIRSEAVETHFEYEGIRTDSQLLWLEADVTIVRGDDGSITRTQSAIRDITERKKAEEELKLSEAKYRSVVENIHEALMIDDAEGNLVYVNNEFSKIYGYSADEFKNLSLKDYTSPESFPEVFERHNNRIKGMKVPEEYEYKGIRKDGTEIWMEARVSAILENGKIIGTQSLERDITERKKAEEERKKITDQLKEISSSIPGAVYQFKISADGTMSFPFMSEGIYELARLTPKEVSENSLAAFSAVHEEDLPGLLRSIEATVLTMEPWFYVFRIKDKEERCKWIRGNSIPHLLPNGEKIWNGTLIDISDLKKTEQEIKESEEKFRTIIKNTSDGFVLYDMESKKVLETNSAYEKMLGYTSEEMKNLTLYDNVLHDKKEIDKYVQVIRQQKFVDIGERMHRRKDGSGIAVDVTVNLLSINGREVISVLVRDISKRLEQEKLLKRSEENYRTLIEHASDGIFISDRNEHFLDANSSACELTGYSKSELLRMVVDDIVIIKSGDTPSRIDEIRNGIRIIQERNMRRKDGSLVPVEVTAKTLPDKRILSIVRDISERKKTERELAESETRFRTVLQSEPECVKQISVNNELLAMNPAGLAMIEADSFEQVAGYSVLNIIDAKHHKAYKKLTANVFNGISGTLEFEITGLKGTHRWMETHSVPLRGEDGKIISLLAITRDITERKKAEEEIIQMNQQLRNLSSHLQNIREEERKKIAREIHDELGQQLTVIKMNLHSLLKKNKKQDVDFTEKATAISDYINQTIDTVRRISSELRPVILDDFGIADALKMHSKEFSKRTGIACEIKVEGNEIISDTDTGTQIFRIYQEALTNIARHSKASKVSSILKSENGIIKILVSDNGKGFNPGKISGKKSLGLIMMRERAIGIGGMLEIKSEPGKGTSVVFSVPKEIQPV